MNRAVRGWTAALVLLCSGFLWLQFRHIDGTLPYPRDVDEGFVSGPANRTLVTGNFHPYLFTYPSLPKYLAALGMAVGFLRSASHLEIKDVHQIGNVGYPYYDVPRVMQGARDLFAFLAVVMLGATGAAAWQAFRRPAAIFLAPLILATSQLYFYQAWTYLNVDIVAACFATLALAACLQGTRRPSMGQSVILPGVYAGFAAGSKYTLALVVLPILLAIGLYFSRGRRMWACLAALTTMAVAFLVVVPYSLIDLPGFLNGVAFEAFHYASGHSGFEADPGWPQVLFYGRHFLSELGVIGLIGAGVGLVMAGASDWRRTAVLLSFPVGFLLLLVSQHVHFERNVLSLHPIGAMFLAYGIVRAHAWVLALARRRGWNVDADGRPGVAAALLLVVVAVPFWHARDAFRDRTDSRRLVVDWIEKRVPGDWTIIVPSQLRLDARGLKAHGAKVAEVDLQSAQSADAFLRLVGGQPQPAVILLPHWAADARFPGEDTAKALNTAEDHLRMLKAFGTNPVLVNYAEPVPWGDPAFGVAVIGQARLPQ